MQARTEGSALRLPLRMEADFDLDDHLSNSGKLGLPKAYMQAYMQAVYTRCVDPRTGGM